MSHGIELWPFTSIRIFSRSHKLNIYNTDCFSNGAYAIYNNSKLYYKTNLTFIFTFLFYLNIQTTIYILNRVDFTKQHNGWRLSCASTLEKTAKLKKTGGVLASDLNRVLACRRLEAKFY